jgi:hypothetical protein
MRITQYKGVLELINSVIEATEYMKEHNSGELCSLCAQSLHSVLSTVKDEENSDELITMINDAVDCFENEVYDSEDLIELIKSIKEKAAKDLKYRLRALFVAELGGKWDSMASVYKAFTERDDCDVDVVLQPVFREVKLPDGSIRHEEANYDWLTTMEIPHIPYNLYDMKNIRPDVTFFSQPYESCTDPMFWPENMAKYTRVVYLPYFAAITMNTVSSAFMSFFELNTQKYSWRIACQSDVMKKLYEKNATLKGKNVIVTGIPKWDYPISLNKTNTPVPKHWKDKLSGRKVFLWNTHFSADSCGSQIFTEKTIQFLNFFLTNKDKIALIWRPHPMLETVIKVYYPENTWEYYLNLKREIEESPNMIIDNNPTYDSAFVWSDALISDFSTLMDQYLFMHKPILMLTNDDIEKARELFSDKELCDYSMLEFANTQEMVCKFIENICDGNENEYIVRQDSIIQKYFKLADGECGKRVTNMIVDDVKNELFTYTRSTDIIVFGTLKDSTACLDQFKENNTDYYLCDMFISAEEAKQYNTISMDELNDIDYKCIVVTNKECFDMIRNILIENYNISNDKILDFWKYYNMFIPPMLCDKRMLDQRIKEYSGLILGISHTEVGIIADKFRKPFCNLSISSQDLFYQYSTLEYIYEKYPQKINKLEYAIIDLYDYNYFNYDTSLSKNIVNYWMWGGYSLKAHNFGNNKLFDEDYDSILNKLNASRYSEGKEKLLEIWGEYFPNIYSHADFQGFDGKYNISNRMRIVTDEEIDNYEYNRATVTKIHESTIEENKQIFVKLLELLKEINPNIKVYTIVIPKYIETENRDREQLSAHENYFNEIVKELGEKYHFTHLDLKILSKLSHIKEFYFDAAHLNYYGAYMLTKMLDNLLFGQ